MYSLRNKHHSWCTCIYFILCTLYISWNRLYPWKKNGVEYILSRVENIKILFNWVNTQLCWWQWFENFLSWGRPQHLSMELRLSTVLSWWRWGQGWLGQLNGWLRRAKNQNENLRLLGIAPLIPLSLEYIHNVPNRKNTQ